MSDKKDKKKQIKDDLEDLMKNFSTGLGNVDDSDEESVIVDNKMKDLEKKNANIDIDKLDIGFKKKATDIINSMCKFYLDAGIITKQGYLKKKNEVNALSFSNMFYQTKTLKFAINSIIEQIADGGINDKLYIALGVLEEKLSNVTKIQANYIIFLEETFKQARIEHGMGVKGLPENDNKALEEPDSYYISANSKEMIKEITEINNDDEEEIIELDNKENRLVDPKYKDELMEEKNIKRDKKVKDDDYDSIIEVI